MATTLLKFTAAVALTVPLAAIASACGSDSATVFIEEAPDGSSEAGPPGPEFVQPGTPDASPSPAPTVSVTCGSATCGQGQTCANGQCTCPPYTTFCNGACIPTVADPSNCGGCGLKCTGQLACSAGTCAATCMPGLEKCANTCVDTKSDNQNCGACGTVCAAGEGCVDGKCSAAVTLNGNSPTTCAGGGWSPSVSPATGECAGSIAQTVFRWTVCSCKDAQFSGSWLMDGYDSTKGPYAPGGLGAGFGANEDYGTSGTGELWGTMWIAGSGGIAPSLAHTVKVDVRSGGELKSIAPFVIGSDAYALGNASGAVKVGGTLHLATGNTASGTVQYGALAPPQALTVVPPCDFCAPGDQLPIAAYVAASVTNNDNAVIGLAANALANPSEPIRLDLPCGRYYLNQIASSHHVSIVAHGRTALFIDGDVSPTGLTIAADPGSELSVFVKGSISTSGVLRIGSPQFPAAFRVYVAGTAGVSISDGVRIAGNLYVPNGAVQYSSSSDQYGAIYAGNFSTSKNLFIHYDYAVLSSGNACEPPKGGGTSEGGTGTGGPAACGSCNDCGNQACIQGSCGACSASAQCCPPLVCVNGGCQAATQIK